jgi:hypothetical protein
VAGKFWFAGYNESSNHRGQKPLQSIIGFLQDLGWGVTAGIALLVIGVVVFRFTHWGESKKEKAERLARDKERKKAR